MTNEEKFKSRKERVDAFAKFCDSHDCTDCPIFISSNYEPCIKAWIKIEAVEGKEMNDSESESQGCLKQAPIQ